MVVVIWVLLVDRFLLSIQEDHCHQLHTPSAVILLLRAINRRGVLILAQSFELAMCSGSRINHIKVFLSYNYHIDGETKAVLYRHFLVFFFAGGSLARYGLYKKLPSHPFLSLGYQQHVQVKETTEKETNSQ